MSEVEERKETQNTKRREEKDLKIEHKGNCKEVLVSEVLGQPPFVYKGLRSPILQCYSGKTWLKEFRRKGKAVRKRHVEHITGFGDSILLLVLLRGDSNFKPHMLWLRRVSPILHAPWCTCGCMRHHSGYLA